MYSNSTIHNINVNETIRQLNSTIPITADAQLTNSVMSAVDEDNNIQKLIVNEYSRLEVVNPKPELNAIGFKITDSTGTGIVSNGKRYIGIIAMGKTITLGLNEQRSFIPNMPANKFCYLPTANENLKVVSTSTLDKTGSGGATAVVIVGRAFDFTKIIEVVTLNGQTAVTTTNQFYRIEIAQVWSTEGTSIGGANKGALYITSNSATFTAGVPNDFNNVIGSMIVGDGFFYQGTLSCPPSADIVLTQVVVSMSAIGKESTILLRMWGRSQFSGSAWHSYANKYFTSDLVVSESNGFPSITVDSDGTNWTDFSFTVERLTGTGTGASNVPSTYFISGYLILPIDTYG